MIKDYNILSLNNAFIKNYVELHNKDIPKAKFKIGKVVNVTPFNKSIESGMGKILAVCNTGDGIEYAVEGFNVLFWEEELS